MYVASGFRIVRMMKLSPLFDLRILLVEDAFLIADELVHLLSEWGCDVIGPAPTLSAALHLSDVPGIDGALLDVNLGKEMVFAVAEKLAARNIPFLFLSAHSTPSAFPPEFQTVPRVTKPFDPAVLEAAMTENLLVRYEISRRKRLPFDESGIRFEALDAV
jgi:DNA-binding response OmpR family regulator